ncbi:MAG: glycosyltransferase family 9 protein [Planctomycetes bacterium]|nr:glycosyltransferase family 9 protein [Planctomycetota bacterium]
MREGPIRRILIVKPSSLGDLVHTLPLANAIKDHWPEVEIDWLVNRAFEPLLSGHPAIARTFPFDRAGLRGPAGLWRGRRDLALLVRELRARRYDLSLDLQGLLRSGLFSFFSGARLRVGFANAREGSPLFYDRRIAPPDRLVHAIHRNLALVAAIGVPAPARPEFRLPVLPAARQAVRAALGSAVAPPSTGRAGAPAPRGAKDAATSRRVVSVFPLGRWSSKFWPPGRCAELLDGLALRPDLLPVLGGSGDERPYAREVASLARSPFLDLVGKTDLPGLVALVAESSVVVAQDSAALHLASALGRPTVGLFGPSTPRYSGPFGVPNRIVRLGLSCSPCLERRCPLGTTACLAELPGERVLSGVLSLLEKIG